MSTTPIDYTALAKQAGAVDSQPAPSQNASTSNPSSSAAPIDYTALAKQAGAIDSQPAPQTSAPASDTGFLAAAKRDTVGAVSSMYHAFKDPVTPEEQAQLSKKIADYNISRGTLDPKNPNHMDSSIAANPSTATLAYHRLLDAPADQLNAKGDNELAAAKDLYDNQHKWAGIGLSMSGAVDKILAHVPVLGPVVNSIADRWESGDHIGALTDMGSIIALERLNAKLTGETAPKPSWVGKTTEAIAKPVGEIAGKTVARVNPFRSSATATADAAAATSKIEPAVTKITAKAGLVPGESGVTTAEANAQNAQATIDAQATTQANVDKTIQDIAAQHASVNKIPAPAAGTATRDILTTNGDALVEAGKANYKILDKFTDGKFTNAQNELKNAQLELRTKAGMTDVDPGSLEANVTRAQWNVDQLFDNAVKNGMPQETADAARIQFRTGQATLDAANDVRMANKVRGPAGARTTDLNALENRWTSRYDSGRLQQAFGEQGAKDAITQVRAARETAEVTASMPPTESQALRDLIRNHTTSGKFGTTTDWSGVSKGFSQMNDLGTRFSDIPKVEKFINDQRFYQNLGRGIVKKVGQGALGATGVGLYEWATH